MPIIRGDVGIKSWSYEILIGEDGVELCEDCVEANGDDPTSDLYMPVFAETECDREPTCSQCGYVSFIFSPTAECMRNWAFMLKDYVVTRNGNRDFLDRVFENAYFCLGWEPDEDAWLDLYREVRDYERKQERGNSSV